jgi:hypothetical protein
MVDYHDYYSTIRGHHPFAVNSGNSWTITTPLSFMNMPILTYIAEISPRPVPPIHGENAHSRYFSETAYAAAAQPKELMIIPEASHTDLYDLVDVLPFDKLTTFLTQHLATAARALDALRRPHPGEQYARMRMNWMTRPTVGFMPLNTSDFPVGSRNQNWQ